MGSAKLALIGAVYTILNLYTFSFNSTDSTTGFAAYTVGNTTQAEQLSKAGVGLAIVKMGDSSTVFNFSNTVTAMGGTVTYSVRKVYYSSDRIISSSTTFGNANVVTTARVYFDSDKDIWRISKISSTTTVKNNVQ
jgi:hypothetical protein